MASPKICSKPTVALAASLLSIASGASAAVVCNSAAPMPQLVPLTSAGIYVNFVTGVFNVSPGLVPGWDFNPFSASALSFFGAAIPTNYVSNGTVISVLGTGATIGPAQTYSLGNSATLMANWRLTNTGQYLGVRFRNEVTGVDNFGCVQLDTVAPNGIQATIRGYCYEDTGVAMTACGSLPVELQSFSVE